MVSNTEVVIALGMPDTVHYRSHGDGDCTSKYQELVREVNNCFSRLLNWKILSPGRCTRDYDDKNVDIFRRMCCYG